MTTAQKVIKYLAIAFAVFLIVNILSAIFWGLYSFSFIFGLNTEEYEESYLENGENEITSFEYEDIDTLDIEVAFSSLTIKTGEKFKIETDNNYISCKQKDKTIKVDEKSHNWFSKNNRGEVIIYIPNNLEFDRLKINTGAGKIDIEKIATRNLSLEIGAGETKIEELNVTNKAKIDGGAGKVSILSGTINNLDLDMGVGAVELNAKLEGDTDIDAGIGELDININASKEDYRIKAEKGIGNITIDGKGVSNDTVYGDGENYLKIDGGIGNIKIKFE